MPMIKSLRPDFAPEWLALLALAALNLVWTQAIGFHLTGWLAILAVPGLGLCAAATLRFRGIPKGSVIAEYFALSLAAALLFRVLSYACLASSAPLIDVQLTAADRALGFDWMGQYQFLKAHPLPAKILEIAYGSLVYQGLYFCVLMSLMGRRARMRQMFWLVFIAGVFTSIGVMLFPALGPFKVFNTAPPGSFVPEMERILRGQDLNFVLVDMTGVVSFPSFHTTMALAHIWGFRRTGIIGWFILVLNVLMLMAIPYYGGHYLVDMIAGGAVMLMSLAIVKTAPRVWQLFREPMLFERDAAPGFAARNANEDCASPVSAEASGDAY